MIPQRPRLHNRLRPCIGWAKAKKEAQTERYRPGAHRSFRPRHRHWLRGLLLAVLVLAVLFLLYGCAVQRLIYSSRGTMIFLPERPLL